MVDAVDRMIEAASAGILLSAEEQVTIFGQRWEPSWVAGADRGVDPDSATWT